MDELASSVGISKRTLYENFKDKEDILLQSMLAKREEKNREVIEIIKTSENVTEVFLQILDVHVKKPFPKPKFYEDIYKYYPKIYQLLLEENESNKISLRKFLQEGIDTGYIRDNLNVEIAAFLVEETMTANIQAVYIAKPRFSIQEVFFTMMVNFIRGISTYKGIEIIDEYLANLNNKK